MSSLALLISVDDEIIVGIRNKFVCTNCQWMHSLRIEVAYLYSRNYHCVQPDTNSNSNIFKFLIIIVLFYN
jgi:hypothetical protein